MRAQAHPPRPRRVARALVAAGLLAAALVGSLAGCGGDGAGGDDAGGEVTLTVLAASSLTDVFEEAGEVYEEAHPGVEVRFSFAGSQELAAQVRQGMPADVLVTADQTTMDGVTEETGEPAVIARNELTIVTRPGNPESIAGLADLAEPGLRVVLAAPDVPAGRYGQEILDRRSLDVSPVSEEPNVRSVLTKVELGEADAGLVYVTDAAVAGDAVHTVPIPAEQNVVAAYPAAALNGSAHPDQAGDLVAWFGGHRAQGLLRDAGFLAP